jgi:hypothetical protein
MTLTDNLTTEKVALTALLEAEYSNQNLRGDLLERLFFIRFLLGEFVGSEGGISGTLPPFAATPTFDIGTAPNLTITNTAFTANAGTNLNTSLLALESGGNLSEVLTLNYQVT